jgi:hypothetical protein
MTYEEEDTCMTYEEEDTCLQPAACPLASLYLCLSISVSLSLSLYLPLVEASDAENDNFFCK